LKQTLRTAILLTLACTALGVLSNLAQAQKLDVAFGVSTVTAPSATFSSGVETAPSLSGGAYPGFSFDGIFWHHLGIGTEIFWRASQSDNYLGSGFNYRPLYYAFNAVYTPKLAKHTYLELVAGMGAMSTRIYSGTVCGPYSCSNYQSFNHFMGDFGAGVKFYVKGGFFIRPEARVYLIDNNTVNYNNVGYSSSYATRVGGSIGYTFGGH
jgi:Outer membrane protein beta-barrel domain